MAKPIDEIALSWRSLRSTELTAGWRTVAVLSEYPNVFRAALSHPSQCEALLVRFSSASIPHKDQLPNGIGFEVSVVAHDDPRASWLCLTRTPSGTFELFRTMVSDLVEALCALLPCADSVAVTAFLARISAWQDFMRRTSSQLSPEDELGLVGELTFLAELLGNSIDANLAIAAWKGPKRGVVDFDLGDVAFEVKTTLSTTGFIASINSIEQLSDRPRSPLFLVATRLELSDRGLTLPQLVDTLRQLLESNSFLKTEFTSLLLLVGYHEADQDKYDRKFFKANTYVLPVKDGFPRMNRAETPSGIIKARYEIDLSKELSNTVELADALNLLRVK
jgi:hypothetical protein